MAEQQSGLAKIGQIHVTARDLQRAVKFYRDVLGMRFLFEVPNMAFFDCGGVRLMLGAPDTDEFDHAASILYYDVPDIRAMHGTLKARGVEFRDEPHKVADLGTKELWMTFFGDSEGNVCALMSEVGKG